MCTLEIAMALSGPFHNFYTMQNHMTEQVWIEVNQRVNELPAKSCAHPDAGSWNVTRRSSYCLTWPVTQTNTYTGTQAQSVYLINYV